MGMRRASHPLKLFLFFRTLLSTYLKTTFPNIYKLYSTVYT